MAAEANLAEAGEAAGSTEEEEVDTASGGGPGASTRNINNVD
jgi:hypothetical protein